jgi:hypothetical protein
MEDNMPKNAKEFFLLVAFGLVPLAFIVTFGVAIWNTFLATTAPPTFTTGFVIIAGGSAGAVGAAVAITLGVPTGRGSNGIKQLGSQYGKLSFSRASEKWQTFIGWTYLVAYFVLGVAAIVVWVTKSGMGGGPDLVPELVNTLAASVWGLILGAAAKKANE